MSTVLLFLLLVCGPLLSTSQSATPAPCIEINAETNNDALIGVFQQLIARIISGASAPQPDVDQPTLEPYFINRAGPFQIVGPLNLPVTVEILNATVEGLRSATINITQVAGSGASRTVTFNLNIPRMVLTSGRFRTTSPISLSGTVTASATDVRMSGTVQVQPGQSGRFNATATVSGALQVTLNPNLQPPVESQRRLLELVLLEEAVGILDRSILAVVRNDCP